MRNYTFQYLSRHMGKEQRDSIKRLHKVNKKNKIVEIYVQRSKIEKELMNYNIHHFTQAHRTKAYNDKIYEELRKDNIREKILK